MRKESYMEKIINIEKINRAVMDRYARRSD